MGYIYRIFHRETGKSYVGKTTGSVKGRFNHHASKSGRKLEIGKDIYLHGRDTFGVDVLEECDDDLLGEREIFWISKLNTYKGYGYNNTSGRNGGGIRTERLTWTCHNPDCGRQFQRLECHVSNPATVTCSKECRNRFDSFNFRGEGNPNYKEGQIFNTSLCDCGGEKYYLAKKCAKCAGRAKCADGTTSVTSKLESAKEILPAVDSYSAWARAVGVSVQTITRYAARESLDCSHFKYSRKPYDQLKLRETDLKK